MVYRTEFKEPFYKGGRIRTRIPGWCDRILIHSRRSMEEKLQPERKILSKKIENEKKMQNEKKIENVNEEKNENEKKIENVNLEKNENEKKIEHQEKMQNEKKMVNQKKTNFHHAYKSILDGWGMDVSDHSPVVCVLNLRGSTRGGGAEKNKKPSRHTVHPPIQNMRPQKNTRKIGRKKTRSTMGFFGAFLTKTSSATSSAMEFISNGFSKRSSKPKEELVECTVQKIKFSHSIRTKINSLSIIYPAPFECDFTSFKCHLFEGEFLQNASFIMERNLVVVVVKKKYFLN